MSYGPTTRTDETLSGHVSGETVEACTLFGTDERANLLGKSTASLTVSSPI